MGGSLTSDCHRREYLQVDRQKVCHLTSLVKVEGWPLIGPNMHTSKSRPEPEARKAAWLLRFLILRWGLLDQSRPCFLVRTAPLWYPCVPERWAVSGAIPRGNGRSARDLNALQMPRATKH